MKRTAPEVEARVRRLVYGAGLSVRAAARESGLALSTVQRCLRLNFSEKKSRKKS
jgi:transposase